MQRAVKNFFFQQKAEIFLLRYIKFYGILLWNGKMAVTENNNNNYSKNNIILIWKFAHEKFTKSWGKKCL